MRSFLPGQHPRSLSSTTSLQQNHLLKTRIPLHYGPISGLRPTRQLRIRVQTGHLQGEGPVLYGRRVWDLQGDDLRYGKPLSSPLPLSTR